ncbi:MAG: response regulator [Actinomycetota bacterium]|nr:response regulator [Actinomycetota bacterium]
MAGESILLVDDDRLIQKMVSTHLQRAGYRMGIAGNGVEALALVREHVPDLVITDVRMPELNGLELTAQLRKHHLTARVPIIMFSSEASANDMVVGYSSGADEYLPKPFEIAVLEAKIQSLLRRSRPVPLVGTERGKVVTFAHGKGGVGTTTLAVNISIAMATSSAGTVGLLDLNVEFGNDAMFLNLRPEYTLADLEKFSTEQVSGDPEIFNRFITRHHTDVRLVVATDAPERAELVTLPAVQLAIDRMRRDNAFVVIDTPASFTERTLLAIDASDLICLVTSPSLPSMKATLDCIKVFEKLGVAEPKMLLVYNHSTTDGASIDQAVKFFGRAPDYVVPRSINLDHAANSGRPLVESNPPDAWVADLKGLAGKIATVLQD